MTEETKIEMSINHNHREGYYQGKKDAIQDFVKFIDKNTHEVGGEICLDDDITILAEQFNGDND